MYIFGLAKEKGTLSINGKHTGQLGKLQVYKTYGCFPGRAGKSIVNYKPPTNSSFIDFTSPVASCYCRLSGGGRFTLRPCLPFSRTGRSVVVYNLVLPPLQQCALLACQIMVRMSDPFIRRRKRSHYCLLNSCNRVENWHH